MGQPDEIYVFMLKLVGSDDDRFQQKQNEIKSLIRQVKLTENHQCHIKINKVVLENDGFTVYNLLTNQKEKI